MSAFPPKADISSILRCGFKDVVGHHRTANALERELTHRLDGHSILDLREHPRTNQDLPGFCFIAEPRSNVGYGADGGIIEASLKTDGAERGKPVCNADAETNVVPPPMPSLSQCSNSVTHFKRHKHRLQRGVF